MSVPTTEWMIPSGINSGWFLGGGTPPPPPKIGKNMICWRKIVIFHTKYPCSRLPSLGPIFLSAPPLTWNPGSAPGYPRGLIIYQHRYLLSGWYSQGLIVYQHRYRPYRVSDTLGGSIVYQHRYRPSDCNNNINYLI